MYRFLRLALLALALPAASAQAPQPIPPDSLPPGAGFAWERVGDRPLNARVLTFAPDGTLWAGRSGGIYRMAPPITAGGVWEERHPLHGATALLVLGRGANGDTLISVQGHTFRSVDGGQTWTDVFPNGVDGSLARGPAGILLVGTASAVRSTDRGATWTDATYTEGLQGAYALLPLPPTPSRPAWHVLAGGVNGILVSADTARSFMPSAMYTRHRYGIYRLAAVEAPGGPAGVPARALAAGFDTAFPGARVWTSDDGGRTWAERGSLRDVLDGGAGYTGPKALVALGPQAPHSAVAVLGRGAMHRTDDGGETWALVGRLPLEGATEEERRSNRVQDVILGPDGRLYVALARPGLSSNWVWVYRTADPVVVGAEETAEPGNAGLALSVVPNPVTDSAALTLSLARPSPVCVAVYDLLGREVALLYEGALPAGTHVLPFDGSALPAGVYVVRARAGEGVTTVRLTVAGR